MSTKPRGTKIPPRGCPTYDRCRYVLEWTAVKIRWGLTVDTTEKSALTQQAAQCTNVTLTVTTV